jgi:hypothetical protein
MLANRLAAVPVQSFVANGGTDGSVTISSPTLFRVGQHVIVTANSLPNLELEVKRISGALMVVGARGSSPAGVDLSAYTVASSAAIFANEQNRPNVTSDEFLRSVYEEEPVVAKRVVLVDEDGNKYNDLNPIPTSATINVPPITVDTVGQGAPAVNASAWPIKVSDGVDSVGISTVSGAKALKVDVVQATQPALVNPTYVNDSGFIAKSVSYFWTAGGDIDRVETIIGTKKKIEQYTYSGNNLSGLTVIIVDV